MSHNYLFNMRGAKLMIAEEAIGYKKWSPVARIYRDEGNCRSWSWKSEISETGCGIYKSKKDAKKAAEEYILSLLSKKEQIENGVGVGYGMRDPETGEVYQEGPGKTGVVFSDPALDEPGVEKGLRLVTKEQEVDQALLDAARFVEKNFPGDMQAMEVAGKAFLAARDLSLD